MRSCPQVLSERLGAGQTLGESGRRLYSLWWLSHPRALGWLLPIPDKNLHLRLFVLGFHFSVYKKEGNRVKGTGMEVRVLSKYLVYKFWLKLMNVSHHNKHQIKSKGEKTWLFILLTCISLLGIYATGIPLQGRNGIQIRSSTAALLGEQRETSECPPLRGWLNTSPGCQGMACSIYKEWGNSLWADTAGAPRHDAKLKKIRSRTYV